MYFQLFPIIDSKPDLFCLIPAWPVYRVVDLAPLNWKQTLQDPETKHRLDDNIFRAATLAARFHLANRFQRKLRIPVQADHFERKEATRVFGLLREIVLLGQA